MATEQEEFLKDLGGEQEDVFTKDLNPEQGQEGVKKDNEEEEAHAKNRRERRLEAKLQAEREAGIHLAARLEALTEAQKFRQEAAPAGDYLSAIDRIYGSETPEAREATELLKNTLRGLSEETRKATIEEFRAEQRKSQEQVKQNEAQLDTMLEEIEDETGADLSDTARKGFLTLLERMSPKDREGNILHYADHRAVWEVYQSQNKKTNPAKDIASRSMTQSGASTESTLPDDSNWRELKKMGIF